MDKTVAGLLGAVGALAAAGSVNAMPGAPALDTGVLEARSYSDLLKPIPNAVALLRQQDSQAMENDALVEQAQLYIGTPRYRRHHHHHHHRYVRHHHHHDRAAASES